MIRPCTLHSQHLTDADAAATPPPWLRMGRPSPTRPAQIFSRYYMKFTGMNQDQIEQATCRDHFMTPEQAKVGGRGEGRAGGRRERGGRRAGGGGLRFAGGDLLHVVRGACEAGWQL